MHLPLEADMVRELNLRGCR